MLNRGLTCACHCFAFLAALACRPDARRRPAPPATPEQRIDRLEKQVRQVQGQVFPKGQPADTAGFADDPAATQIQRQPAVQPARRGRAADGRADPRVARRMAIASRRWRPSSRGCAPTRTAACARSKPAAATARDDRPADATRPRPTTMPPPIAPRPSPTPARRTSRPDPAPRPDDAAEAAYDTRLPAVGRRSAMTRRSPRCARCLGLSRPPPGQLGEQPRRPRLARQGPAARRGRGAARQLPRATPRASAPPTACSTSARR